MLPVHERVWQRRSKGQWIKRHYRHWGGGRASIAFAGWVARREPRDCQVKRDLPSSTAREYSDGCRDKDPVLDRLHCIRASKRSLQDKAQRTYLDIASLINSCQTKDMHDYLQSEGLPKRNVLGWMTQCGSGIMEGEGGAGVW
jgi:hypothetical protein